MTVKLDQSELKIHRGMSGGLKVTSYSAPFIISFLFHLVIVLIAYLGLPSLYTPRPEQEPNPITIEFVDIEIADKTQSDKPSTEKPTQQEAKPEKLMDKPKVYTPPKMTAMAPPILTRPEPPKVVETPENEPLEPPAPEVALRDLDSKEDPPKKKPIPNRKPRVKPVVPKKIVEFVKDEEAEPVQDQFSSLMRSLVDAKPSANEEVEQIAHVSRKAENIIDRLGDRLTLSEQDALIQQLSGCWNFLTSGGKNAEELSVEVRLYVNADRTVSQADILDKSKYANDSFFKAAADSALRAVRNPNCIPLRLPEDKYDQWKTIVVNFDPSEMF